MTPQGIASALDLLSDIGVLGVAGFVIWGFLTERIVPKGRLEELRKEAEEAKERHADDLKAIRAELQRLADKVR